MTKTCTIIALLRPYLHDSIHIKETKKRMIYLCNKLLEKNLIFVIFRIFYKWLNTVKVKTGISDEQRESKSPLQWCKDYKLVEWGPRSLFPEYLEMG
jgi:hypothetical protein